MRKWILKKETDQQTFSETRKGTKNLQEKVAKNRKPTNKLKIVNFCQTPETNLKFANRRRQETDNQIEILKLFLKTRNGPKKKRKPIQKNGKQIKCKYSGNVSKILGKPSILFSFLRDF